MTTTTGEITIRRVTAGDEAAITCLIDGLDAESRYRRWFTGAIDVRRAVEWASHPERVEAIGLLAFAGDEPVGHAVMIPAPGGRAEIAFEVAAAWRYHGVAGTLLEELLTAATARDLTELYACVLGENADMLAVLREHGEHSETREGSVVTVTVPVPQRLVVS